jgi:hypothetical protein
MILNLPTTLEEVCLEMLHGSRACGMMYIGIFVLFLLCINVLDNTILIWGNGALQKGKTIGSAHLLTKPVVAIPLFDSLP